MKVMTYNIVHKPLEVLWRKRFNKVVEFIKNENPDVIGMQEIIGKGYRYFKKKLDNYYVLGESRHSVIFTNEYNPLLIKKDYELISYNTYSLSDNINKLGTKTKEDNYPRICVLAHIRKDNDKYLVINTHIDNSNSKNKKRLLDILKSIIEKEFNDDEYLILLGDYNMTLDNDNLAEFSKEFNNPFKENCYGSFCVNPKVKSIDHIFVDKRLDYCDDKIHKNTNDERVLSDHYPLSCIIKKEK
jgi:endonuclease/exonuclease/phosphatase family metal-dependent hydrolase